MTKNKPDPVSLTWQQVNAWRLSQQNLSSRLPPSGLIQAVGRSMGVHAQVMSAAEMAIGARVDGISPQDVQSALWQERTLVKTWMMRQTLHLVPATDFQMYIAARRQTDINWPAIFEQAGIDRPTLDAYLAVAPEILDRGPVTRQQFIEAVAERLKSPGLRDYLANGSWGTAFKPLAWRGELCFGPNDGTTTTFIRPTAWLGNWQSQDPEAAIREVARHYLRVYGPAKVRNFQVWWWMSGIAAKKAFDSISDETAEVDVEGWRAVALRSAIDSMKGLEPVGAVHLLPAFDVYTVGLARGKDLEPLFTIEQQKKVYSQQGWVSAVVLVDGFIKGTWVQKAQKLHDTITLDLFSPVTVGVKDEITAQAERVGKFLNKKIQVIFTQNL